MGEQLKQLRKAGECATCACRLRASTHAWRESKLKTVTCVACHQLQAAGLAGRPRVTSLATPQPATSQISTPPAPADHHKHELSATSVLLNDRKITRTRRSIDHLAVTRGGVWIIQSKNYKGNVEQRDVGQMYKSDIHLFVNGRDRSKALRGMERQHKAVTQALTALRRPEVPVHHALCLPNAEWPLLWKPLKVDGVWIVWAPAIVEIADNAWLLGEDDVAILAGQLGTIFPAK